MSDQEREILKDIVKNRFGKMGYSDKSIVEDVNEKDLLKLNGAKISETHVSKIRKELDLRMPKKNRYSGRSKKTRETDEPIKATTAPRTKIVGDNHPVTIADLLAAIEKAQQMVQQFADQERNRLGI